MSSNDTQGQRQLCAWLDQTSFRGMRGELLTTAHDINTLNLVQETHNNNLIFFENHLVTLEKDFRTMKSMLLVWKQYSFPLLL